MSAQEGYAPTDEFKARARVAELEAKLAELIAAAHKAGWNGVENSKILSVFIESLGEERDDLSKRIAELEAQPDLSGEVASLRNQEQRDQKRIAELESQLAALVNRIAELSCEWRSEARLPALREMSNSLQLETLAAELDALPGGSVSTSELAVTNVVLRERIAELEKRLEVLDDAFDRLKTVVDESFGMQEVLEPDDLVTRLEELDSLRNRRLGESLLQGERDQKRIAELEKRAETAEANYRFMVERAADAKLDGYRELGERAAAAENERDDLRKRIKELKSQLADERDQRAWFARYHEAAALACGALDVPGGGFDPDGVVRRIEALKSQLAAERAANAEFDAALVWLAENAELLATRWQTVSPLREYAWEEFDHTAPASIRAALVRLHKRATGGTDG